MKGTKTPPVCHAKSFLYRGIPNSRARDALKLSLIQQAVAFIFSATVLDGGDLFTMVLSAIGAFWIMAAMILWRRGQQPTTLDLLLLKWGFFPITVGLPLLTYWLRRVCGYA